MSTSESVAQDASSSATSKPDRYVRTDDAGGRADAFWTRRKLFVVVHRTQNLPPSTVELPLPLARVGSAPGADLRLSPSVAGHREHLLCVTRWGVYAAALVPPADDGKASGRWLERDAWLALGAVRIAAAAHGEESREWAPEAGGRPDLLARDIEPDEATQLQVEVPHARQWPIERRLHRRLTLVGRGKPAALRIDDASLSRVHCAFYQEEGRLWVIDLLGRGGTWLSTEADASGGAPPRSTADGAGVPPVKVNVAELHAGSCVAIGDVRLRVVRVGGSPGGVSAADRRAGRTIVGLRGDPPRKGRTAPPPARADLDAQTSSWGASGAAAAAGLLDTAPASPPAGRAAEESEPTSESQRSLHDAVARLEAERDNLRRALADERQSRLAINEQLQAMRQSVAATQSERAAQRGLADRAPREWEQERARLAKALEAAEQRSAESERRIASLAAEGDRLQNELNEARLAAKAAQEEGEHRRAQAAAELAAERRLRQEAEIGLAEQTARLEATEARAAALEQELAQTKRHREEIAAVVDSLRAREKQQRKQCEGQSARLREVESARDQHARQAEQLAVRLAEAEQATERLARELSESRREIERLGRERNKKRASARKTRAESRAAGAALESVRKQLAERETELGELRDLARQDREALEQSLDQARAAQAQCESLGEQLVSAFEERRRAEQHAADLAARIEVLTTEVGSLRASLAEQTELRGLLKASEAARQQAASDLDTLSAQRENAEQQYRRRLAELEEQIEAGARAGAQAAEKASQAVLAQRRAEEESEALRRRLADQELLGAQAQAAVRSREDELESQRRTIAAQRQELTQSAQASARLQRDVQELEAEVARHRSEQARTAARLERLEAENLRLLGLLERRGARRRGSGGTEGGAPLGAPPPEVDEELVPVNIIDDAPGGDELAELPHPPLPRRSAAAVAPEPRAHELEVEAHDFDVTQALLRRQLEVERELRAPARRLLMWIALGALGSVGLAGTVLALVLG